MSIRNALYLAAPTVVLLAYYLSPGSVKEAEEFDRLPPEESRRRLALLLPKMDVNGDQHIDRIELKMWILNSFRFVYYIFFLFM